MTVKLRCCRSEPRCRACPIVLNKELQDVRRLGLGQPRQELAPHLAGLPECLHKYGPLFERQLDDQRGAEVSAA